MIQDPSCFIFLCSRVIFILGPYLVQSHSTTVLVYTFFFLIFIDFVISHVSFIIVNLNGLSLIQSVVSKCLSFLFAKSYLEIVFLSNRAYLRYLMQTLIRTQ